MNVAFLGLGGNMGDRLENLQSTREAIKRKCGSLTALSGIYETEAWGSDSEKKYLNQVVKLETDLSVEELLLSLQETEAELGRKRTEQQNSDRTADIDILFYNTAVLHSSSIQIPHPRLHLRKFVLVPLSEIAADLIHPLLHKSIAELLKACDDSLDVKRI